MTPSPPVISLHLGDEVLACVVDRVRRAVSRRQRAFLVRACGADQVQAERARPLAGDQADAAGRRMEQHDGRPPSGRPAARAAQQVLHRQALSIIAAPVSKSIASGSLTTHLAGMHARLAVGAGRRGWRRPRGRRPQVRDALAHRLDDARALHAEASGSGSGYSAGALIDVDEVDAAGAVADAHLARPRLADLRPRPARIASGPPGASMRMARLLCSCDLLCVDARDSRATGKSRAAPGNRLSCLHAPPDHRSQPRPRRAVGRHADATAASTTSVQRAFASSIAGEIPPDQSLPEIWIERRAISSRPRAACCTSCAIRRRATGSAAAARNASTAPSSNAGTAARPCRRLERHGAIRASTRARPCS